MNTAHSVEQWRMANAHRLIDCRWGGRLTLEACRAYQSRRDRHVIHFNGGSEPQCRVNADYILCCLPHPCPHLVPDEQIAMPVTNRTADGAIVNPARKVLAARARRLERLVSPDRMLSEGDWCRSLIIK